MQVQNIEGILGDYKAVPDLDLPFNKYKYEINKKCQFLFEEELNVDEICKSSEHDFEPELIRTNVSELPVIPIKIGIHNLDEPSLDTKPIIATKAPTNEKNYYSDFETEFNIENLTNIKKSEYPIDKWIVEANKSAKFINMQINILGKNFGLKKSKKVMDNLQNSIFPEICISIRGNKIIIDKNEA